MLSKLFSYLSFNFLSKQFSLKNTKSFFLYSEEDVIYHNDTNEWVRKEMFLSFKLNLLFSKKSEDRKKILRTHD